MENQEFRIEFADEIASIPAEEWNLLMSEKGKACCPFNRHEYLSALETSGAASPKTGWTPMHLTVFMDEKRIAVMPLYSKMHSYGEYVFDWAWAQAYERNQVQYYPKLLSAIPFTPVTGARLGISQALETTQVEAVWSNIVNALNQRLEKDGFSGWHCLFLPRQQSARLAKRQALMRTGTQFHWLNRGYTSFEDFLSRMSARKRKNIRKERDKISQYELKFTFIDACNITDAQWQSFYLCYQMTYAKRSGHYGYLNLSFFKTLGRTMADSVKLLIVEESNQDVATANLVVASALYFKSATHLYGRYWGALQDYDALHYEACYYTGIEYCIKHGLAVFDAGAQGEHKLARGFEPMITYSNHEISHPAFREAIEAFTEQETEQIRRYMKDAVKLLPFKGED
ncbi:N-acetyltransferase [Shewanella canadensis]|uniref:N-acetyltransferase n=1 Tax=Shewanella canadensis TaxID=271096 RepID=A0A3S0J7Y7_9GAMM|nr:GNAT family N-acetyltransferase [Shewanella canadensis]RTR39829.1 N-acetyltransferase [Shewanella canadensis]